MITIDKINSIYDKYNTLAANPAADICTDRHLHDLMMFAFDSNFVDFDGDRLTFAKGEGPLSSVEIERIAGVEDLGSRFAIVLPASVIFLNKRNGEVHVYLAEQD